MSSSSSNAINRLPTITDFTQADFSRENPILTRIDPSSRQVHGTNIHYQGAGSDSPSGVWAVGGQRISAGQLVLAKCYRGYLNNNDTIATYLSSMNVNTRFSRAANAFAASMREVAPNSLSIGTKTYEELRNLATRHAAEVGLTADAFLAQVLPNATAGSIYIASDWNGLIDKVAQYSSAKLTDNSVLQQKLDTCTANRNALVEAMTSLMRSWNAFLQTLSKGI